LKKVGLDTARAVLDLAPEELVKRSDLEEETVKEIMKILSEELD
jgi:N utilization substance protein A